MVDTELFKVVNRSYGRPSPWGITEREMCVHHRRLPCTNLMMCPRSPALTSPSPPAARRSILPQFMRSVVLEHPNRSTIMNWFDGVYLLLHRCEEDYLSPLQARLSAEQDAAVRWAAGSPDVSFLHLGWCLLNRQLDERCIAIELLEVPEAMRRHGCGRALLALLEQEQPGQILLPSEPAKGSEGFWRKCCARALHKFVAVHGVDEAKSLCQTRLKWPFGLFEEMLQDTSFI